MPVEAQLSVPIWAARVSVCTQPETWNIVRLKICLKILFVDLCMSFLTFPPLFLGGSEAPQQDFSDGLLEVFCLVSSLHIAQLQVGLGEPIRLGQCSSLKVKYDLIWSFPFEIQDIHLTIFNAYVGILFTNELLFTKAIFPIGLGRWIPGFIQDTKEQLFLLK